MIYEYDDNLVHLHPPGGLGGHKGHEDGEEASHYPGDAVKIVHSASVM